MLLAIAGISNVANAEVGTIKVITSAPAGTSLRISYYPYDATVNGADYGGFFGVYTSKGEGTEITISGEGLNQLEVFGCELTRLDVVSAPDLFILKCYDNKLEALDLSGCEKLEILDCHNNLIEKLDVSGNPILEKLYVNHNKLSSLEIGTQEQLGLLNCSDNPLSALDVANCPELNELYFQNCQLSALDLSNNTKLDWIYAFNNSLSGESMANFIATMPEALTTGLIYIVDTRAEDETNVCTMADVKAFAEKGWATMDYLGGAGSDTQLGKFYPGCDYVPTVSERKISFTTSRQAGEKITLNIGSSANISISGVEESGASGKLTYTLTSSNVEILGDITSFECPGNDITELNFSDPSLLTYIECQDNRIETLNLKGARALKQLYCQNNALTSLNVYDCVSLMRVNCYSNQLKGMGMRAFMKSLYQATDEPYLFVIDTKADGNSEGNIATTIDVKIAIDKGWEVFDYENGANYGMGVAYSGSEPTLPEQYFTVTRTEPDYIMFNVTFSDSEYTPIIEGGELSGWNGTGLTINMTEKTITVYGDALMIQALFANIEAIDVTNLPNLTELNVALNDITELDLSGNPQLTTLSCECNLIKTLDLANCPQIDFINCYGNQIKDDGMTDMINSLPRRSPSYTGQMIVYDPTYSHEGNVCLKSDVSAANAKNWVIFRLSADSEGPILYEGEDPAGIESVCVSDAISYDYANAIIAIAHPGVITVYNASGRLVAKANNATSLSLANLPTGPYIARSGNSVIKIVK